MSRSNRKLFGGGAAALALGGLLVLIVAPQLAGASSTGHRTDKTAGVTNVMPRAAALLTGLPVKKTVPVVHSTVAAGSSCTTARANLAVAVAQDKTEDASEHANATSKSTSTAMELAEDKAEFAVRKALVGAVRTQCGLAKPTLSAACTAVLQSLKAAIAAESGEDQAERSAGTEGSSADVAEDQSEKASIGPLWSAVSTSCGFRTRTHDFALFGSTKSWSFQR
jgi:hypothetical protein